MALIMYAKKKLFKYLPWPLIKTKPLLHPFFKTVKIVNMTNKNEKKIKIIAQQIR